MASATREVFLTEYRNGVVKALKQFENVSQMKPAQEEALLNFIERRDVLAVLPTGSGKSLIFQVVPAVVAHLSEKGFAYPGNPIIIVVCPLNALIESHIKELDKYKIPACCIAEGVEEDMRGGKFSVVFANPETLTNKKWREMLMTPFYQKNLFGLVTDEAHVVPKWGKGNAKERKIAFRECFLRLRELRSLFPSGSPVLALTATATADVRKETIEGLALKPNTHEIVISPNRPNIYLYKAKVNKSLDCFIWLINILKNQNINTPKTIIYCKSQKHCGQLYKHFKLQLGVSAFFPLDAKPVSKNSLIGMFHSNTLEKYKKIVIDSLFDLNGATCRVVFATAALGMGINVKDIRQVIHYGPPREMDDFVQELGRAGRDGMDAKSILFYTGRHLNKCSEVIKNYAKSSKDCLRNILLNEFGESKHDTVNVKGHKCCVICHAQCSCTDSGCEEAMPTYVSPSLEQERKTRKVSKDQKEELRELLIDYQKQLESSCPVYLKCMSSESTTGFSNALIKCILKNLKTIFCLDDLLELTPVYKKSHAVEIMFMIKDVFEDIELDIDFTFNTIDDELNFDFDYDFGGYDLDGSSDDSSDSNSSMVSLASAMSDSIE